MASIVFADFVASGLASAARLLADRLSGQSGQRGSVADAVMADFKGSYATACAQGFTVASEDRAKLAGCMRDLAAAVDRVRAQAEQERERLAAVQAWEEQEERTKGVPPLLRAPDLMHPALPQPSLVPLRPESITASYRARERPRHGGSGGGTSSADPAKLTSGAAQLSTADANLRDAAQGVQTSAKAFQTWCSWAPVTSLSAVDAIGVWLEENGRTNAWLRSIAAAFEAAGSGGALSDVVLDLVVGASLTPGMKRLLDPTLTSAQVAEQWRELGIKPQELSALPLGLQLRYANLDGLPAAARDVASRGVLDAAVTDPKAAYLAMGGESTGLSFEDFETQIKGVSDGLTQADALARRVKGSAGTAAQLVGLQIGDGTVLAAVSLGNMDTAGSVTVNVPGATTTVTSMPEKVKAAAALLSNASDQSPGSYAVVSWIGYRAPQFHEVGMAYVAKAGAPRLAGFLDGLHESRSKNPAASINVTAHSYGSTTSSYALQQTKYPVDAFLSYGSVGFDDELQREQLKAGKVYATRAAQDSTAIVGLTASALDDTGGMAPPTHLRTDPQLLPWVETFSSEGPGHEATVTGHDMFHEGDGQVGYLSPGAASTYFMGGVIAGENED